jgi:hypothetical protein
MTTFPVFQSTHTHTRTHTHMNVRAAMFEYLEVGYKRRSGIYLLSFVKVSNVFK